MKTNLKHISIFLSFFLFPTFTQACGLGMISISDGELAFILGVLVAIFLAGYLPYVMLSVKLSQQAGTENGASLSVKVGASIFALINTGVFLSCLAVVAEFNPLILICDVLLWGVPMFFYVKGMFTRPSTPSGMLDA